MISDPRGNAGRVCGACGADLNGRRADARYCSTACRNRAWRDHDAARAFWKGLGAIGRPARPRGRV